MMAPGTVEKHNWLWSSIGCTRLEGGWLGRILPHCRISFQAEEPHQQKTFSPSLTPSPSGLWRGVAHLTRTPKARTGCKRTRQQSSFPLEQTCLCRVWVLTTLGCASSLSESLATPGGSQWPSLAWMGMGSPRPKLSLRQSALHQDCLYYKSNNILVS